MKLFNIIELYLFLIFIDLIIGKTTLDFKNHIFKIDEPVLFLVFLILSTIWFVVAIIYGEIK